MTQAELISKFPTQNSIANRVLLISPDLFPQLKSISVHECRIFLLVTQGTVTVETGYTLNHIEANGFIDMLVWEPISFVDMSPDLQAWCLLPNYLFTNESINGMKPADSESFKDRHTIPLLHLTNEETIILESQLQLLLSALKKQTHFYRTELCQTYFRSLMLEMGNLIQHKRKNTEDTEKVESRQSMIMRNFLKLVWKYYKSEHNIEFYAEKLCLSSKHLSRVVKEKLGKTPHTVIKEELIQRATYLLKNTKMSIQDIASELHFSEMAAFCKFFKKHNGISPTAYRSINSLDINTK